jgi:membrane protein DedA with SNARE-associated domain
MRNRIRKFAGDGRIRLLLFFAAFLGAVVGVGLWRSGIGADDLRRGWALGQDFLRERPLWLFLALVVLPGLPVPTSALLFLAGVVWRDRPVEACVIAIVAMTMNLTWTYWLAAGWGRVEIVPAGLESQYESIKSL